MLWGGVSERQSAACLMPSPLFILAAEIHQGDGVRPGDDVNLEVAKLLLRKGREGWLVTVTVKEESALAPAPTPSRLALRQDQRGGPRGWDPGPGKPLQRWGPGGVTKECSPP